MRAVRAIGGWITALGRRVLTGRVVTRLWLFVCLIGLAAGLVHAAFAQGADGTFDRAWGKDVGGPGVGICTMAANCRAGAFGTLGGEFARPRYIAPSPGGSVYVADFNNRRIDKFDSSGTFVAAWGKDVGGASVGICTVAASCQAGGVGTLGGEFNRPYGVATDANGNVYVADNANNRIQKFDSSGGFIRAWGKDVGGAGNDVCTVADHCQAGNPGGLGGELDGPAGLATDANANVYATEINNRRVDKFDSSGNFLSAWGKDVGGAGVGICTAAASCQPGTFGALGGEFNAVSAVGIDGAGSVYTADFNNRRIDKFGSSGAFLRAWGKDVGGAGVGICTVAASCQAGSSGALGGEFSFPEGVAADAAGTVYTADASNNRIDKFDSSGTFLSARGKDVGGVGADICTMAAGCRAGTQSGLGGAFSAPVGITSNAAGDLYVADTGNVRIQKFAAPPQQRTLTVTVSGSGSGTVTGPGIDCTGGAHANNSCSTTVADGTQVTLTATPTDPGSTFGGFTGAGCGATSPCTVTMNADQTVDARFDPSGPPQRTLTVTVSGNGSGTVTGPGINCTGGAHANNSCSTTVADGTQVTLTATPTDPGSTFGGFTGGGCGATSPCTVTMNADQTVDARFDPSGPQQRTLTVTVSGSGPGGTVIGPGIDCRGGAHANNRCSTTVADGTQIMLTATPEAGSSFTRFTGGGCGTASPCTVTMNSDQTVDAKFESSTPPGSAPVNVRPPFVTYSLYRDAFVCNPGTWENLPANPTFGYEWLRRGPGNAHQRVAIVVVATTQTYQPSAADATKSFACRVTATNDAGSTVAISAYGPLNPLAVPTLNQTADIHVTGIEVTQGIQENGENNSCVGCAGTLPSRDQANTSTPGEADYQGVTLAAGKYTVVRVYATFTQPTDQSILGGATATLRVYDSNGVQLSTLNPLSSPAALIRTTDYVNASERAKPGASFNFVIPWQTTLHRALSFRATVTPAAGLEGQPTQCAICKANTFELIGVPFVSTAAVPVHPIPLTIGGAGPRFTQSQWFGSAQTVLPNQVTIFPDDTPLPVDNMNTDQALAAVLQRASDDGLTGSDYPIGVFNDRLGVLGGGTATGPRLYDQDGPYSVARDDRPLTSAMHEIGHGLGLVHADSGSQVPGTNPASFTDPHPDGTADCGGNSNNQLGEFWPPDNEGRIQGIGLDRRSWNIGQSGSLPQTVVEGYDHAGKALQTNYFYYDFMSYCLKTDSNAQLEADHWISVRNWERLIAFHPPVQSLPAAADRRARAASGVPLRVIATVDSGGRTSIFSVEPGRVATAGPTAGSPYRIELRDHAGTRLASVTPNVTSLHVDGRPGHPLLLQATLPLVPAAAVVAVSAGGIELARRTRSAHAPTVRLVSPHAGNAIGRRRTTLVRWKARDADGDHLTATVDYSADGGRHWRVVADRLSGSSARVPSRALSASRNGRLRVRVSDGFDTTTAMSSRLVSAGAPPSVRIIGSGQGGRVRVRADMMLLLQGSAFDDAGRALTGRRLRWYAGRRLLGRGELLSVVGLPLGTKAIRLLATDRHGRTSSTTLALKVLPVPPAFLLTRAPVRVARSARNVRIVVATTIPAVLTIAGIRHRVDRRPRTITIKIRPGRSILRVKYSLSSHDAVMRGTYLALR